MTRTHRSISTQALRLAVVAGVSLAAAPAAQAQWGRVSNADRQLVFEWHGEVDRETQIHVGRNGATVRGSYGDESRGRFMNRGSLPRGSGTLYIQRLEGRGGVDVIQQPVSNGGDGVIRIRDTQGGRDYYAIRVYWQPTGGTVADGRRRDGDWDRGDRDDRRADQADRRADRLERRAEKLEEKAEKARRKADRRDDRDDRNGRRRW